MSGDAARPDGFGPLPPRQGLSDDVYERLKSLIMDHVIEPGARIPIDAVARDLGVSQTPVREALARLESDDLVTKTAMRGYCATALLTRRQLEELYEMRLLLEPWAAGRAAALATPADARALREELATCAEAPAGADYEAYRALTGHDARFHDRVLRIAGNDAIRTAFDRSHAHLHLFRLHYVSGIGTRAIEEHRAVVEAITAGDPDAAEAAMRQHLVAARDRLIPVTT